MLSRMCIGCLAGVLAAGNSSFAAFQANEPGPNSPPGTSIPRARPAAGGANTFFGSLGGFFGLTPPLSGVFSQFAQPGSYLTQSVSTGPLFESVAIASAVYRSTRPGFEGINAFVYQIDNDSNFTIGGAGDPFTLSGWDATVPTLLGPNTGGGAQNINRYSATLSGTGFVGDADGGLFSGFFGFLTADSNVAWAVLTGDPSIPGGPMQLTTAAPLPDSLGNILGTSTQLLVLFAPSDRPIGLGTITVNVNGTPVNLNALVPTPEPISLGLLASGAAAAVVLRRRLQRTA